MKKGQLQISFGMIFSIILIIATVAVAFYVISYFIKLGNNVSCKLYYTDLQDRITVAWNGELSNEVFSESLPSGVSEVCFGYLNQSTRSSSDASVQESLRAYPSAKSNLFFYPRGSTCNDGNFAYHLTHVKDSAFFCVKVVKGKARVTINKGTKDALVNLNP